MSFRGDSRDSTALYVNEQKASVPAVYDKAIPLYHSSTLQLNQVFIVPPSSYFVLGDNVAASQDSRIQGAVPIDAIDAIVLFCLAGCM
jgi:signal peptidase I